MRPGHHHLNSLGITADDVQPPTSTARFPDAGAWRVEIASVEGPDAMRAVVDEASRRDVPVHRVSQGSGVMMLEDNDITEMLRIGTDNNIEVCLFLGPRGTWDTGGAVRSSSGGAGPRARGTDQLGQALEDAVRATELGVRNLLVADEGVLWSLHQMRENGSIPNDVRLKVSVLTGPVNPASATVWAGLGADSLNLPGDLTVAQVAEIRSASPIAIDFYLESPDDVGGFVRHYDGAELIRVGAPIYLKFGLRNSPALYPAGRHLHNAAVDTARERVRRARLALNILDRAGGPPLSMSPVGDPTLPVPNRFPGFTT